MELTAFSNIYSHEGRVSIKTDELPSSAAEIYNVRPWSYKDLPNDMLNLGLFTDTDKDGELHGCTCTLFTQDDTHIFVLGTIGRKSLKN
jgi:threonyl-tRNA synthetase